MADLLPGTMLETVLLGSMRGDVLRIWRADGEAECRAVQDPDALAGVLGRGLLARTSSEPNRFREVALLDATSGVMLLTRRGHLRPGADQVSAEAAAVQTHPCSAPPPDEAMWKAWARWVGHLLLDAASRGEYLVVETGTWDSVPEPYVLMGVFPGPSRAWIGHVEAKPTPAFPPWTMPGEIGPSTPVSAPANLETVGVAGLLAIQAVGMWARTPFDVVLTFGISPGGPWSPEAPDLSTATPGGLR
jgi:hypothetical protein